MFAAYNQQATFSPNGGTKEYFFHSEDCDNFMSYHDIRTGFQQYFLIKIIESKTWYQCCDIEISYLFLIIQSLFYIINGYEWHSTRFNDCKQNLIEVVYNISPANY